jgi:hypothetical protein
MADYSVSIIKGLMLSGIIIGIFAFFTFYLAEQAQHYRPCNPDKSMDCAVLSLQEHCLIDDMNANYNNVFCDKFMNQSGILSTYKWEQLK